MTPYKHRNNQDTRAIQKYKHHLKAGLASVDPKFLLAEWHRLIEQANITLNLLRTARVNPKLSAYSYIFGEFNFAATSLAPLGTKVVANVSTEKRGLWELNADVGWYVGPSMNHYRNFSICFPKTHSTRDCDTIKFFPHDTPFPKIKTIDFLHQAATDIVDILKNPPSTTTPSLAAGYPVRNALLTLTTQLKNIDHIQENK